MVPLRPNLPEGWYLIYWRAISVDGHPVNGFFTYAVGPNPGPAPQFRIPNISATATTPQLLITRWAMFVFVMAAIGLFVMRLLVARPVVRSVEGVSLKPMSVAVAISAALGLIAIPVYLDVSTANDSLRSAFDVTALVPLFRVTAFGRAMVDLELAFPSGRTSLDVKLADVKYAVAAGADEVDMVIDRGAFLAGRYLDVFEEIVAVRAACAFDGQAGRAHLKVILETGELVTLDNVRRASWLAMLAGADFIKTSTGKVTPAATLPVTMVMLEAVRDFRETHGRQVGVKAAGGIRTAKDAIRYLVLVNETAGEDWLAPQWFRIGASSLLNDLLMQRTKMATGRYSGPDYFTLD